MKTLLMLTFFVSGALFAQSAGSMHKALSAEAKGVEGWAADELLVEAAKTQNARGVSLEEIMKIDEEWLAGNVRSEVTEGACADRLRGIIAGNDRYAEVFVMDKQGALVCSSRITSDYFQGDEAKWTRAFAEGRGAVFIDRPRFDESTKASLAQISAPLRDGREVVGVITFGIFAEKLFAKPAAQ